MPAYIVRRILLMIPTLLGAVTLIFLLMRLLPGDVALYILGSGESSNVNKEALEQIRQELGLDQPLIVQYGKWLWGAARIFVIAGLSIPNFWLAILVILGLVHYFQWLPPLNYEPFWTAPWLNFKQLIFPALITGYRLSAICARMTRSSILAVLRDDFVRTARAKGLR